VGSLLRPESLHEAAGGGTPGRSTTTVQHRLRTVLTLIFDISVLVASSSARRTLDFGGLTTAIEDFNTFFIRLPSVRRFSFSTLSVLHTLDRKGPLRLTDLTATEQLKQPALTSLVARLERDGLVSRRRDPRDARAVLISLTREGREIVASRHAERA
jgi:DNA-binding MarR family transcriptional regulator